MFHNNPGFPIISHLPIMGRDGTVAKVQVNAPAAGHVYAKTGTAIMMHIAPENADAAKPGPNGPRTREIDPSKNGVDLAEAVSPGTSNFPTALVVFAEFLEMKGFGFKGFEPFDQVMGEIASVVYDSLVSRSR